MPHIKQQAFYYPERCCAQNSKYIRLQHLSFAVQLSALEDSFERELWVTFFSIFTSLPSPLALPSSPSVRYNLAEADAIHMGHTLAAVKGFPLIGCAASIRFTCEGKSTLGMPSQVSMRLAPSRGPPAFSSKAHSSIRPARRPCLLVRAEKVLIANTKGGGHGRSRKPKCLTRCEYVSKTQRRQLCSFHWSSLGEAAAQRRSLSHNSQRRRKGTGPT